MGSLCLCNSNDRGHICIYSEIKVFEVINTADDLFFFFLAMFKMEREAYFFASSLLNFSRLSLVTLSHSAANAIEQILVSFF